LEKYENNHLLFDNTIIRHQSPAKIVIHFLTNFSYLLTDITHGEGCFCSISDEVGTNPPRKTWKATVGRRVEIKKGEGRQGKMGIVGLHLFSKYL